MNELVGITGHIPAMSDAAIDNVRKLEAVVKTHPQCVMDTSHLIHGGVYLRTITMPENTVLTGALVKIDTTLIINGYVTVYMDANTAIFEGYNVVPASAGRKQAIVAHTETTLTMLFPTDATSIEEAEVEFTDEVAILGSRKDGSVNTVIVTGG